MAGGSDIRAGRAFVELYAKTAPLMRAMRQAEQTLMAWGAKVRHIGASLMAAGGLILTPLVAAVKRFADTGSQLDDMAARTGLSTNALSELGYAAEMSGASLEEVEKAIRAMQKKGFDASKFDEIAAEIAAIEDPSERAKKAMEVFGKSGTMLLPMLAHIKELREEARELGLSIDPETAKAAEELGDAWDRIKKILDIGFLSVGKAIAPVFLGIADAMKGAAKGVVEFIQKNESLIRKVALVAAGVVAAGAAIVGLGFIFTGLGAAIGGVVSIVSGMAAVLGAAFGAVTTVLGLIASPMGLVITGLVALGGYFGWTSGVIQSAIKKISTTWKGLVKDTSEALGAIGDALSAGDIQTALDIAVAYIRLEWQKVVNFLIEKWEGFKQFYHEAVGGLAIGMLTGVAQIKKIWAGMLGWMHKRFADFMTSGVGEMMLNISFGVQEAMGQDVSIQRIAAKQWLAALRSNRTGYDAGIDAETEKRKAEIDADLGQQTGTIGDDLARQRQEREKKEAELQRDYEERQAAFAEATARGRKKRRNWFSDKDTGEGSAAPSFGMGSKLSGTFSARAAAGMSGDSTSRDIRDLRQQTIAANRQRDELLRFLRQLQTAWGDA